MKAVMLATEKQEENYWMLLEILTWLPVKDLLRFMCVSKHWKTLISSSSFRKLHHEKHASSPPLLIAFCDNSPMKMPYNYYYIDDLPESEICHYLVTSDFEGKSVEKIKLPLPSATYALTIPSYQSKLLFFSSSQWMGFYLYNPSTRQSFLLPKSYSSSPEFQGYWMAGSSTCGYMPSKDEYIIAHLVKLNGKLVCELLNVSISSDNFKLHYGEWRSVNDVESTTRVHKVPGKAVFVGGAFYWHVRTMEINEERFFLSFDVENESFSTFGYPADYPEDCRGSDSELFLLDDELYLVCFPESPDFVCIGDDTYEKCFIETPAILVLWKLSSDKESWSRYWEFDCERLFGFKKGAAYDTRYFRWELFIYHLKYLKGYDQQPADHQVSVEMGELTLVDGRDGFPLWTVAAVHTNLLTL